LGFVALTTFLWGRTRRYFRLWRYYPREIWRWCLRNIWHHSTKNTAPCSI